MKASKAREIIEQAIEDETFDGQVPDDDKKAIEVASGLIDMAVDAWTQDIRGEEVENILRLAERLDEDGDLVEAEEEPEEKPAPKAKPKPAAKSKPKPKPKAAEPEPEPEPEEEVDPRASEEPWDGYSTDPVKDIIEGIEVWGEAEEYGDVQHVLVFESANKNRVRIVNKCVEILPEDQIPGKVEAEEPVEEEVDAEPVADDDALTEPYEGYTDAKIKNIKESLQEYVDSDDYDNEDKLATLEGTIAFEKANKNRTSLISFTEALKANLEGGDGEDDEAGAASEEGDAEDAAASAADAGAEDGGEGSTSNRSRAGSAAAKRAGRSGSGSSGGSSDAEFVISTTIGDTDIQFTLNGKFAVAGVLLDLIENGATAITVDVG